MTEFTGPSLDQYLIVMGFILAIFLIFIFIKKNRHVISNKLHNQKRMKVSDVTLLGQGDRALILQIDQRDYLFISGKNSGAILTEIKNNNTPTFTSEQQTKVEKKNKKAFEITSLIEKRLKNEK